MAAKMAATGYISVTNSARRLILVSAGLRTAEYRYERILLQAVAISDDDIKAQSNCPAAPGKIVKKSLARLVRRCNTTHAHNVQYDNFY